MNSESSDRSFGLCLDELFYELNPDEIQTLWLLRFDVPIFQLSNQIQDNQTHLGAIRRYSNLTGGGLVGIKESEFLSAMDQETVQTAH